MIKKLFLLSALALCLTSCYTSKIYHGQMHEDSPMVEVASKTNPFFLWGLVGTEKSNEKASDVIGDRQNYTTENKWTFVNGLLSCITFGIYSPTTTKIYLPVENN